LCFYLRVYGKTLQRNMPRPACQQSCRDADLSADDPENGVPTAGHITAA
jgi:hypothetical protein